MSVKIINKRACPLRVESLFGYEIATLDASGTGLGRPDVLGSREYLIFNTERSTIIELEEEKITVKIS